MLSVNEKGVPPGTFSDGFIRHVESTMNATIREAVFVSEHLDTGSTEDALNALLQIQMNTERVLHGIERRIKKVKP